MDSPVVERDPQLFTAGCTNDDPKRLKVLEELMVTEQHYIRDLSVLIKGYIVPLRNSQILTENDVEQLCFNIEAIEALHIDIFANMLKLIEQYKTDATRPLSYYIAEYFNSLSDQLKLYSTYSSETPDRIAKDPLFVMFVERMRAGTGSKLHLDDYLIKPIQRICKYPLLFRELERNTPPSDDHYAFFQDIVRTLDGVVQLVNDARKQFEAVKRVIEVESMLSDLPEPLVASGRVLVKEGPLQKQSPREGSFRQERYCFLFRGPARQDILVYTKMKNKKSYAFRGRIELSSSYMKDLPLPQIGFVLFHPNNPKSYTFFCKSQVEKQTWMAELVSMVIPTKPAGPAGSFVKSASRPAGQTVVNRQSGGVMFRTSRQHSPPSPSPSGVSYLDGADSGDYSGDSTPPTFSPLQRGSNWFRLRASNDSDKSESDEQPIGSPPVHDGNHFRDLSTTAMPIQYEQAYIRPSSDALDNRSHALNRANSNLSQSNPESQSDDQKELHRLHSIIVSLESKLQAETDLRIRLEKELHSTRQKLHQYESAQASPPTIAPPRQPVPESDEQAQLLLQQQQLIQQQLQQQQQQLLLQQQILLQQQQQQHQQQQQLQQQQQSLTNHGSDEQSSTQNHTDQSSESQVNDTNWVNQAKCESTPDDAAEENIKSVTASIDAQQNQQQDTTEEPVVYAEPQHTHSQDPLTIEPESELEPTLTTPTSTPAPEAASEPTPSSEATHPRSEDAVVSTQETEPLGTPEATTDAHAEQPADTAKSTPSTTPTETPIETSAETATPIESSAETVTPAEEITPTQAPTETTESLDTTEPSSATTTNDEQPTTSTTSPETPEMVPTTETIPLETTVPTSTPTPTPTTTTTPIATEDATPSTHKDAAPDLSPHSQAQAQAAEHPPLPKAQRGLPQLPPTPPRHLPPLPPLPPKAFTSPPLSPALQPEPEHLSTDKQEPTIPPPSQQPTTQPSQPSQSEKGLPSLLRGFSESNLPPVPDFEEDYAWIKEGSLTKMGDVVQSWKSRWFRLAPGFLLYFKTLRDSPKKYLGVVHLTKEVTVARSTKKNFCIAIRTPSREWLLCAVTERETSEWIAAITSAIGST